jgi:hypothetical protein
MVMARPCTRDVRTSYRASVVENFISRSGKSELLMLFVKASRCDIGRINLS